MPERRPQRLRPTHELDRCRAHPLTGTTGSAGEPDPRRGGSAFALPTTLPSRPAPAPALLPRRPNAEVTRSCRQVAARILSRFPPIRPAPLARVRLHPSASAAGPDRDDPLRNASSSKGQTVFGAARAVPAEERDRRPGGLSLTADRAANVWVRVDSRGRGTSSTEADIATPGLRDGPSDGAAALLPQPPVRRRSSSLSRASRAPRIGPPSILRPVARSTGSGPPLGTAGLLSLSDSARGDYGIPPRERQPQALRRAGLLCVGERRGATLSPSSPRDRGSSGAHRAPRTRRSPRGETRG